MSDLDMPDSLSHKVGPLPLGVWLVAIAGGVGVAWWVRTHGSSSADNTADPTVPDGTNYTQPNGVGQDSGSSDSSSGTGSVAPTPTTNEEWGQLAIRQMIARGYDPTMVDRAIRDYLAGNTLTTVERALIAETLAVFGPPPVPPPPEVPGGTTPPTTTPIPPPTKKPDPPTKIPPTKAPPKPPAKPKPTGPPKYRTITISPANNSLSKAVAAYNKRYKTHVTWQDVWNFNLRYRNASTVKTLKARGPNKVFIGSTFWVPM
jgi:hypothetical protein